MSESIPPILSQLEPVSYPPALREAVSFFETEAARFRIHLDDACGMPSDWRRTWDRSSQWGLWGNKHWPTKYGAQGWIPHMIERSPFHVAAWQRASASVVVLFARHQAAGISIGQEQCLQRSVKYPVIWKVWRLFNVGPEKEMTAALKTIDDFVYGLMDDLVAGKRDLNVSSTSEEDDLLRRLLPAAKRDDGSYDRKLVRDMLLNLIIAGRDTTAASMSWTLYELCRHPKVLSELLAEIDDIPGPSSAPLTFDAVADCTYLQAVLSESQRLHPSVPFSPKSALKADVLPTANPDGRKLAVEAGATMSFSNYIMGRSTKIWGPDAAEFKPERWLSADGGSYVKADQFKFPAFNAGRRLCLGMDMANLEMKVVLGTLLRRFSFELVPGQDVRPATALTLQMKHGVKLFVAERK